MVEITVDVYDRRTDRGYNFRKKTFDTVDQGATWARTLKNRRGDIIGVKQGNHITFMSCIY